MRTWLAGSLEYSWSGTAPEPPAPEFIASAVPNRNHLIALQATFEQNIGRSQPISINMLQPLEADRKPLDCKALQPKLISDCIQSSLQDKPASTDGCNTAQDLSLKCDMLAKVFKGHYPDQPVEKGMWDTALVDYQPRKGLVCIDADTVLQDQSFTATLLQAKGLEEMVKLIPLINAQANSLEACTNVQDAMSGDQVGEEDSEYDPDDVDSAKPGWDEDINENWANVQRGYSVYAGMPSVEELASEFDSGLDFEYKEETGDTFAISDIPSDTSRPHPQT
ncbi:hypothetical protein BGZ81_009211 [Podila clonocystis]|nr:hypothetical protein BGZ81_009211 [Podila clonocystis]